MPGRVSCLPFAMPQHTVSLWLVFCCSCLGMAHLHCYLRTNSIVMNYLNELPVCGYRCNGLGVPLRLLQRVKTQTNNRRG